MFLKMLLSESPGFPVKYGTNKTCDWEIRVRPGHQVLLKPNTFNVEGQMTEEREIPGRPNNLYHPVDGLHRTRGRFGLPHNSLRLTAPSGAARGLECQFWASPRRPILTPCRSFSARSGHFRQPWAVYA